MKTKKKKEGRRDTKERKKERVSCDGELIRGWLPQQKQGGRTRDISYPGLGTHDIHISRALVHGRALGSWWLRVRVLRGHGHSSPTRRRVRASTTHEDRASSYLVHAIQLESRRGESSRGEASRARLDTRGDHFLVNENFAPVPSGVQRNAPRRGVRERAKATGYAT